MPIERNTSQGLRERVVSSIALALVIAAFVFAREPTIGTAERTALAGRFLFDQHVLEVDHTPAALDLLHQSIVACLLVKSLRSAIGQCLNGPVVREVNHRSVPPLGVCSNRVSWFEYVRFRGRIHRTHYVSRIRISTADFGYAGVIRCVNYVCVRTLEFPGLNNTLSQGQRGGCGQDQASHSSSVGLKERTWDRLSGILKIMRTGSPFEHGAARGNARKRRAQSRPCLHCKRSKCAQDSQKP
jgi:hypothetical protein